MTALTTKSWLVHETPERLRFKQPFLLDQEIDFAWLLARLERLPGVDTVRINRLASSVIFHYSGEPEHRKKIAIFMHRLRREDVPDGKSELPELPELFPMLKTVGIISISPFVSPAIRKLLTWTNILPTIVTGIQTFVSRGVKIEVLDAIAVGLTAHKENYLTANITTFLMQLGGYLERLTEQQSDSLLRNLLQPDIGKAWVEREGVLVQIPGEQVVHGEQVVVGPGEKIPVDGLILDGNALVNQASVTGEDLPVRKEIMDQAIAGTVIEEGKLRIEARHVGEETTTSRIAKFMQDSLGQRSQAQRLADKQADQRVYLTLGTGGLIYLMTGQTRRLESIFLVDYSCALKLGTPVAFKSGMYQAAQSAILLKGAVAMEKLAEIDTVVFDKTGTLTHSHLQVTDVVVLDPHHWDREHLLAVTASIEEHASHPIAEAIVRKAKEEKLNHIDHGEVEYIVAHGMNCPVNGDVLTIGSRHYLEEHENITFDDSEELIDRFESEGKTLLFVGLSHEPVGIIALQTRVREEASKVVEHLHRLGVKHVAMLTGDRLPKAKAMAKELGIDQVFAEKVPEEKAEVIQELQNQGRKVAFVGDGVNDGPALMTADIGIAMPHGAELARATASIILLEDQLELLTEAFEISQNTLNLIRSNYRLAVGVNTFVLLGAAAGKLSPVVTSLLHNGTTVGVLVRALRGA